MTDIGSSEYIELTDEVVKQETEIMRLKARIGDLKHTISDLTERVALLDGLVGDTQDFLKHLIHGDYQYRFGDLVMANGMQHAKELNQHIKEALAALGGRDAT